MKKNHLLKLAFTIAFIVLLLDGFGKDMFNGFMDGFTDSGTKGYTTFVTVDAKSLIHESGDILKIDSTHLLKDVNITARLKGNYEMVPWYLLAIRTLLSLSVCFISFMILNCIFKVVNAISNNHAFEYPVVQYLKKAGYYLLLVFVLCVLLEEVLIVESLAMAGPSLKLVTSIDWHLGLLVASLLVLVIAQAFEQGMELQEEQKLTI